MKLFLWTGLYFVGNDFLFYNCQLPFYQIVDYIAFDPLTFINFNRFYIFFFRERDEDLDVIVLTAQVLVSSLKQSQSSSEEKEHFSLDNLQRASLLALFVSDCFGGSDRSNSILRMRKIMSGSNYEKPFVCTCATGNNFDNKENSREVHHTVERFNLYDLCEKSLRFIKETRNSNVVPIGTLRFGVCRHRAVLMKVILLSIYTSFFSLTFTLQFLFTYVIIIYQPVIFILQYLCDRVDPPIPCELVRGYLDFRPHAWNNILVRRGSSLVRMVVDACHPTDIREETDPEFFCRSITVLFSAYNYLTYVCRLTQTWLVHIHGIYKDFKFRYLYSMLHPCLRRVSPDSD